MSYKPLTDQEWSNVKAHLFGNRAERKRQHDLRDIVEAIRYHAMTEGCEWRHLPDRFPPHQTVFYYFKSWGGLHFLARLQRAISGEPVSMTRRALASQIGALADELRHDLPAVAEILFSLSSFTVLDHKDMIGVLLAKCQDELGTIEGVKSPEVAK